MHIRIYSSKMSLVSQIPLPRASYTVDPLYVCILMHLYMLWGAIAQWLEHLQLKQEALSSFPVATLGFFLFQLAY